MLENIYIQRNISYTPEVMLKADEGIIRLEHSVLAEGEMLDKFFNMLHD